MYEDIYELTKSMRVLLCMHNMCAIDPNSAKGTDDLTGLCGLNHGDVETALGELVNFGYVVRKDHIYYLSGLGISVVRSVYT